MRRSGAPKSQGTLVPWAQLARRVARVGPGGNPLGQGLELSLKLPQGRGVSVPDPLRILQLQL